MTDKIQLGIQNAETNDYEPVGTPIAFGEATDFIPVDIDKEGPGGSGFNTSGNQKRYLSLYRIDGQTGENKGQIQYTNSNGSVVPYTGSKTWYIGRGYLEFMRGVLDNKSFSVSMTEFVAQ